jgi:hypothetical protein
MMNKMAAVLVGNPTAEAVIRTTYESI